MKTVIVPKVSAAQFARATRINKMPKAAVQELAKSYPTGPEGQYTLFDFYGRNRCSKGELADAIAAHEFDKGIVK